ncbi:type II toxin-antitoxin system RelE/ParE family toxin [Pinirhizobacter sp.]|uniref:type II toxin-antitoxin system RelE/ParE family toxin n=1 Tax=Pinirhizobacter sp. TaxID=2950432 RepID=UPI002F4242AA
MKLLWTSTARKDRVNIRTFIERDNPAAALELDEVFSDRTAGLLELPLMGRTGRLKGTRELVVHGNYVVVYDVMKDDIRIIRILHAARRWP